MSSPSCQLLPITNLAQGNDECQRRVMNSDAPDIETHESETRARCKAAPRTVPSNNVRRDYVAR